MNQEFEEFLKTFKPEFGNLSHIQVLKQIERLRGKEKLVKEKLQNQAAINKKLEEIKRDESSIMYVLKQNV